LLATELLNEHEERSMEVKDTTFSRMLREHMATAQIESLDALGDRLGGARGSDPETGARFWADFDRQYIERVISDPDHLIGGIFWRRLFDALRLGPEEARELDEAWLRDLLERAESS
jgi:hypothetical protein